MSCVWNTCGESVGDRVLDIVMDGLCFTGST